MKQPKTFRRPRLYYQHAVNHKSDRIRIIYPDGRSEWLRDGDPEDTDIPCWAEECRCFNYEVYGKCKSAKESLRNMRKYDKLCGWPPANFLGEL
jgi:hypothetical protein